MCVNPVRKIDRNTMREYTESILTAYVFAMLLITFVFRTFMIPSSSMHPTLKVGDRIFVNRFIYRFSDPERGDVIVFIFPGDTKRDFIKRLVGLPGETVEIKNGAVIIDGVPVKEAGICKNTYYGAPGGTYVPPGSFYVLGDNSGNSRDSRYWGFVPEGNLMGKAFFRYWPPRRVGFLH